MPRGDTNHLSAGSLAANMLMECSSPVQPCSINTRRGELVLLGCLSCITQSPITRLSIPPTQPSFFTPHPRALLTTPSPAESTRRASREARAQPGTTSPPKLHSVHKLHRSTHLLLRTAAGETPSLGVPGFDGHSVASHWTLIGNPPLEL